MAKRTMPTTYTRLAGTQHNAMVTRFPGGKTRDVRAMTAANNAAHGRTGAMPLRRNSPTLIDSSRNTRRTYSGAVMP